MILRIDSIGPEVAHLIDALRVLGFSLPAGDRYDTAVRKSVEAFQVANLDASGTPLVVDGKVGPHTQWAINAALHQHPPPPSAFALPALPAGGSANGRAALAIAMAEMTAGRGETLGDNRGPDIERYLNGITAAPASWCAAFVSWCFHAAMGANPIYGYEIGAQNTHNKMQVLGHAYTARLSSPPEPGDLIVWRRVDPNDIKGTSWQGHIGIVYGFVDGNLWTIEGNRGSFPSKVRAFRYSWSELVSSEAADKFKGLFGLSRHP